MPGDPGRPVRMQHRKSEAQLHRDAALRRITRTRGWVIAASAALTAGVAAYVSASAPGRTLGAKMKGDTFVSTGSTHRRTTTQRMPPLATPSQLGLIAGAAPQSGSSGNSGGAGNSGSSGTSGNSGNSGNSGGGGNTGVPAPAAAGNSGAVVSGGS